VASLRADEDPVLHEIADRIDVLTRAIPEQIEESLSELADVVRARDAAGITKGKARVQADVARCADYLKNNLADIDRCEKNPFGIAVSIRAPMEATLQDIEAGLKQL
jgi:hypothetical protein